MFKEMKPLQSVFILLFLLFRVVIIRLRKLTRLRMESTMKLIILRVITSISSACLPQFILKQASFLLHSSAHSQSPFP